MQLIIYTHATVYFQQVFGCCLATTLLTYEKYLDTFVAIFIVAKQFAIFSNHVVVTINTITVKLSLEEEFLENVNGKK